jgi:hypothetical protein
MGFLDRLRMSREFELCEISIDLIMHQFSADRVF